MQEELDLLGIDPKLYKLLSDASVEAAEILKRHPDVGMASFAHFHWSGIKKIMLEKHDISIEEAVDPIIFDPKILKSFCNAAKEASNILKDHPDREKPGFCLRRWAEIGRIMYDKYGVEWRSPSEMNPKWMFD